MSLNESRVCGLPEQLEVGLEVRRSSAATWKLAGNLTRLARDDVRAAVQAAFDAWTAVAGCSGKEVTSGVAADLVITVVQMDGSQGVLADCQLPGPQVQQLRLDDAEAWTVQLGSGVPRGLIDLERVLTHELGHFWGVGHIAIGNLMAPTYSDFIDHPQSGDIAEIVSRYGPATPKPIPAPVPVPGDPNAPDLPVEMWIVGKSGKVTAKFSLTRIG